MKIYTRTGDAGSTGLFGGPRVAKDDDRIEAYGTVDELNAALGVARTALADSDIDPILETVQSELFSIGAELATPDPDQHDLRIIGTTHIERLERWIDQFEQGLEPLRQFILPAGMAAAAHLHVARGICRRAERRVVTLVRHHETNVSEELMIYLNRLGDLLFVLARAANHQAGIEETKWQKPASKS